MTSTTSTSTAASTPPAIRAIAATGLERSQFGPPSRPLDERDWRKLARAVTRRRLEGLLAAAVSDGWPTSERQDEELDRLHESAAIVALGIERRLLGLATELERRDIAFRVLKGPAVAHLDYADPALRSFGDLDLLVHGSSFGAVDELLGRSGERRYPEPRPGFDRFFTKGAAYAEDGVEVDVHRTLAPGPYGLVLDPDRLFESEQGFRLAQRTIPALDAVDRAVHSALHAVLGGREPNVLALRDLAQQLERHPTPGDVGERAAALGLAAPVAVGVRTAADLLAWDPPAAIVGWVAGAAESGRDRRWLAVYGSRRSSAAMALAGIEAVSGWRKRASYALAVMVPRQHRRWDLTTRWRQGWQSLRRASAPGAAR